jgi:hypothetical protein
MTVGKFRFIQTSFDEERGSSRLRTKAEESLAERFTHIFRNNSSGVTTRGARPCSKRKRPIASKAGRFGSIP